MVEIARAEICPRIAHGATGKGNDQSSLRISSRSACADLRVIAPWREERFRKQFSGRSEMIAFAKASGIPVEADCAETGIQWIAICFTSVTRAGVLEDPGLTPVQKNARHVQT